MQHHRCIEVPNWIKFGLSLAALLLAPVGANAEGFDFFSEHQKLNDQLVIASGNISKLTRVSASSTPTQYSSQPKSEVYQLDNWCFSSAESLEGKAGFLLVDRSQSVSVSIITTQIGTIKLSLLPTTLLSCSQVQLQDLKKLMNQAEEQRKQAEALMQSIRQQQQQQLKQNKKTP